MNENRIIYHKLCNCLQIYPYIVMVDGDKKGLPASSYGSSSDNAMEHPYFNGLAQAFSQKFIKSGNLVCF